MTLEITIVLSVTLIVIGTIITNYMTYLAKIEDIRKDQWRERAWEAERKLSLLQSRKVINQ